MSSIDAGSGAMSSPAATTAGAQSGPRAGFWVRLAAAILDAVVLIVPFAIIIAVFPDAVGVAYVALLAGQLVYYIALEGSPSGQTLGKKAVGIRVYDLKQGGQIGYGRAFVRYLGRLPSSFVLYLGYLWMLWDGEKQTWHDKLAGSVVVPTRDYPV